MSKLIKYFCNNKGKIYLVQKALILSVLKKIKSSPDRSRSARAYYSSLVAVNLLLQ